LQAQFLGNLALQFHDHSYSYPYQQYQEEPPSPILAALKETMAASEEIMAASAEASARLERTMLAFLSKAEEDRQEFVRINNSITQSYEKMDAHFKQMMDILKEESVKVSWWQILMSTTWRMSAFTIMSKQPPHLGMKKMLRKIFVSQVLKIVWESTLINFMSKLWLKIKWMRGRWSKLKI
jgi:hypothetical protein